MMTGSHEDYITRHVSGKNKDSFGEEKRVSYLPLLPSVIICILRHASSVSADFVHINMLVTLGWVFMVMELHA